MSTTPSIQPSEPAPDLTPPRAAGALDDSTNGQPQAAEEKRRHAIGDGVTSKVWQLATLVVPIVLTTWLTFWVSQKEDNIKQDIDKQSQLFQQQLQLSEELYKRRFDAYEKLYAQLVQLNARLQKQSGEGMAEWSKTNADQVSQFNELLDLSKLHMSQKIENLTVAAWMAGARGDGPLLSHSIADMEVAMKTELDNWMLEAKAAPGVESVPFKSRKAKSQRGVNREKSD